jgi:hypothetical protein
VETYGAQPPIELLRQMVDNGGYYDLKEKDWRSIVDCVLVCAMVCMGSYTLNATALTKAPALGLFFCRASDVIVFVSSALLLISHVVHL